MKRATSGRTVSKELCIYRIAPDGEEIEIEVDVEGMVNPYWAGNYDNPPEGGDVEDVTASFWDEQAKKDREIPLTEEEVRTFSEELMLQDADDSAYEREYDYKDDHREYYQED